MVGPRPLISKPFKVQKYVMPDLKALMYVKLREENQECGNFMKMYCALLKIGAFVEYQVTDCYTLSLNLQLIKFLSFGA